MPSLKELTLLPPSTANGLLLPRLSFLVTADTGDNKAGLANPTVNLTSNGTPIPVAATGDGYPYNGDGAATAKMQATLTQTAANDSGDTQLVLQTDIFAQSGCCGGLQPGGEACGHRSIGFPG